MKEKQQRGQILVMAAVMIVVLLGLSGLVVDGGQLMVELRKAQTAADAAALAGAYALVEGRTKLEAENTAEAYAASNGYADNATTTVTPDANMSEPKTITVRASRRMNTFLAHLLTRDPTVAASAIAVAKVLPGGSPFSLIALNHTAPEALNVSGSATVNVEGAIMVNSNEPNSAMNVQGNGLVVSEAVSVTGGVRDLAAPSIIPAPQTGVPPVPDPLRNVPKPDYTLLPTQHATAGHPDTLIINGDRTLLSGIYYGGIEIRGNSNVRFRDGYCNGGTWDEAAEVCQGGTWVESGIYYLAGGGLNWNGSGNLIGDQIMIYNGRNEGSCSANCGDGDYGPVTLTGSGNLVLSPINDESHAHYDDYNGIIFFQERASPPGNPDGNTQPITVLGTDSWDMKGTFYAPDAHVLLGGDGDLGTIQLIADTISIQGNGYLNLPRNQAQFYKKPEAYLVR
jgi:Flp pilus assembly protein TadG